MKNYLNGYFIQSNNCRAEKNMKKDENPNKFGKISIIFGFLSLLFLILAFSGFDSFIHIMWFDYLFGWISLIFGIIAIINGAFAIRKKENKKYCLIGLILGIIIVMFILLYVLLIFLILTNSPY
jgi:hypothetical protein